MSRVSGFCVAVCLLFLVSGQPLAAGVEPPELRLGGTVEPLDYEIGLRLDPNSETFTGSVEIRVSVLAPTDVIWLNARDLDFDTAAVAVGEGVVGAEVIDGGDGYVGLKLAEPLSPGTARIRLDYSGLLRKDDVGGLFRRQVADDWYVFSQMEALDARRAFPGFDEPSYKVPFRISITVPKGQTAFFNTPLESRTEEPDGSETFRFQKSQPLPTYLLAFGVGPFDVVDAGTAGRNKTRLRIIVPSGKSAEAKYAAESTRDILELLEDYFGSPYPYEKLDQIAVPNFGGAMEHPGLVTYGQTLILRDPAEDTIPRQRRFASVCAHELAHMWFGDLVTMEWWEDLWLNESFATWMSNKILDKWQPDWDRDVSAVRRRNRALGSDTMTSARKIRQPILSNDDIANAFDGITYGKGASVLAMFELWIGEEKFRQGVRSYINAHAHGNATARGFLDALEKAAGKGVVSAFTTFLDQNGAPKIHAELTCPDDGKPFLSLSQKRFEPADSPAASTQTWTIPVCVEYGVGESRGRQCALMAGKQMTMELESRECPHWVLPNAGMMGYYRVSLSGEMLDRLLEERGSRLTVPEQVGVVSDMNAMILAGALTEGDALNRVPQLLAMSNRHVAADTAGIVGGVDELVTDKLRPTYAAFIREMFGERARELGWTPEPDEEEDTRLLRPALVGLVADEGEDQKLIAEAKALADLWLDDRSAIDPQLISLALRVAARNGNEQLWKSFYEQARTHTEERERDFLFGAMGSFRDEALVRKNLAIILSDEFEIFEVVGLLFGALGQPSTREMAWNWVKENYEAFKAKLPRAYQSFLPRTAGPLCNEEAIADAKAFFGPRVAELEGGPRALDQTLEGMRICVAYRAAQRPSVEAFLRGL